MEKAPGAESRCLDLQGTSANVHPGSLSMAGRVFFPIGHGPLPIGHSLGPVSMEVCDKSIPHPRPESQELAIIWAYLSVSLPHLRPFYLVLQNNS